VWKTEALKNEKGVDKWGVDNGKRGSFGISTAYVGGKNNKTFFLSFK